MGGFSFQAMLGAVCINLNGNCRGSALFFFSLSSFSYHSPWSSFSVFFLLLFALPLFRFITDDQSHDFSLFVIPGKSPTTIPTLRKKKKKKKKTHPYPRMKIHTNYTLHILIYNWTAILFWIFYFIFFH